METQHNSQSGSITLGLVFSLGMLAMGIAATTLTFSTNAVVNNSISGSGVRALVTADSASREGIYRLLEDYNEGDNAVDKFTSPVNIPLLNNVDNATVEATGAWPIYEIRSTSANSRVTRKVVAEVNLFPSGEAFDKAVYTHGELNFSGNVSVNGDVYATNGIDLGGSAEIVGTASTPDTIETSGSAEVTGSSEENHPVILPPTIDISGYMTDAVTTDTYYMSPGGGNVASAIIRNNNISGLYFVDDNLSISGNNTDFTGVLIVTGDLSLTGGDYTTGADTPIVIYVGGNLRLAGNVEVNGIVYVAGETTFGAGTPTINGSLISVNGANKATGGGNITINYDATFANAWHELFEEGLIDGADPTLSNWHEE